MTKIDEALAHAVGQVRPPPVETLLQWIERVVRLPEGSLGSCAKVAATNRPLTNYRMPLLDCC